jgi:hypothetical protein
VASKQVGGALAAAVWPDEGGDAFIEDKFRFAGECFIVLEDEFFESHRSNAWLGFLCGLGGAQYGDIW